MRQRKNAGRLAAWASMGAIVLLGGCAVSVETPRRAPAPLNLQLPGKLVLLSNVDKVRNCKDAECAQPISATGVPSLPAFDCGLSVDQITLASKTVQTLSWTLPPDTPQVQYRFRTAPNSKQSIGIYVTDGSGTFTGGVDPNNSRVFRLTFTGNPRTTQAFKYGVFLDYKPTAQDSEWAPCAPLDPIIISMD